MHLLYFALPGLLLTALAVAPASAQSSTQTTVVQAENVRLDYAHVLNVEPVYQTLRASRTEMRCEENAPTKAEIVEPEEEGRWSKIVSSVKGVFVEESGPEPKALEPVNPKCRMVPVGREFRRPIAYDVDYVYKGMKYRSRLAEDPGNRLRIRVSVMPYVAGQDPAAP